MRIVACLVAGIALVTGCSGATTIDERACPPGGTAYTYENFGKAFLTTLRASGHGGGNAEPRRSSAAVEPIRGWRESI